VFTPGTSIVDFVKPMYRTKPNNSVGWLVLGIVCLTAPSAFPATNPLKLSGAIAGIVTDPSGIPQMGASVTLYNRQERIFEKSLTDERGTFKFIGLFPDVYSIKVTLAAFVPALKKNILVQPGMRSVLNVNLSTLFSNIQFAYPPLENGSLMSDEWKWVLRSGSPRARCCGSPETRWRRTPLRPAEQGQTRGQIRSTPRFSPARAAS